MTSDTTDAKTCYRPRLDLPGGAICMDPREVDDLEWTCRYAYGTEALVANRYEIAEALHHLNYLLTMCPTTRDAQRKLAQMRRAGKEARNA